MQPFRFVPAATASVSVTTSTASAALKGAPSGSFQLRLHNTGTSTVFYNIGSSAVTAAVTDVPLPSGAVEVITIQNPGNSPETHVAAITASGTATLYATTGAGF
jgi:hypothetical protein